MTLHPKVEECDKRFEPLLSTGKVRHTWNRVYLLRAALSLEKRSLLTLPTSYAGMGDVRA